jgi:tuftelin-interacting protein 11
VEDISIKSKEIASHYEATLDVFSADFDKLSLEYGSEYELYQLDEVVVGAIAPHVGLTCTRFGNIAPD